MKFAFNSPLAVCTSVAKLTKKPSVEYWVMPFYFNHEVTAVLEASVGLKRLST